MRFPPRRGPNQYELTVLQVKESRHLRISRKKRVNRHGVRLFPHPARSEIRLDEPTDTDGKILGTI